MSALIISPATASKQIDPGVAYIRITSQVIKRDKTGVYRVSASALYNKRITKNAIGNSIQRCTLVGRRRTLPRGTQFCNITYRMPLGQIVVAGVRSSEVYYKLAIVGGTGVYLNVGGEVRVIATQWKPRKENLVFSLRAFES